MEKCVMITVVIASYGDDGKKEDQSYKRLVAKGGDGRGMEASADILLGMVRQGLERSGFSVAEE